MSFSPWLNKISTKRPMSPWKGRPVVTCDGLESPVVGDKNPEKAEKMSFQRWAKAECKRPRPVDMASTLSKLSGLIQLWQKKTREISSTCRIWSKIFVVKFNQKILCLNQMNDQNCFSNTSPSVELPLPCVPGWRHLCLDLSLLPSPASVVTVGFHTFFSG